VSQRNDAVGVMISLRIFSIEQDRTPASCARTSHIVENRVADHHDLRTNELQVHQTTRRVVDVYEQSASRTTIFEPRQPSRAFAWSLALLACLGARRRRRS
jgi:hypothetical protein